MKRFAEAAGMTTPGRQDHHSNALSSISQLRSFPVPDRSRLVERIVDEIAEASAGAPEPLRSKVSPVGWLADEPEMPISSRSSPERFERAAGCGGATMRTLIDTDIWSEIFRGKNAAILARAAIYLSQHGRHTPMAVTVFEVVQGLRRVPLILQNWRDPTS